MLDSYGAEGARHELAGLIIAARGEDSRAMDNLLRRIRPQLLTFFSRRLRDESAEDLTQVALVRIARAIHRIDPERADSYITTVAWNLLRTAYRRRSRDARRFAAPGITDQLEASTDIERSSDYEDLARAVHRLSMTAMPPALREVVLGLMRGLTSEEIAAAHGISPITVRTRLLRARIMLKRELRDYLDTATETHPTASSARQARKRRCGD